MTSFSLRELIRIFFTLGGLQSWLDFVWGEWEATWQFKGLVQNLTIYLKNAIFRTPELNCDVGQGFCNEIGPFNSIKLLFYDTYFQFCVHILAFLKAYLHIFKCIFYQ
jgi:hypothetical protein